MDKHAPPGSTMKGSEASMVKGRAWGFSEVKAHQKKGKKKHECLRKCKLLHYAWDRLRERLVGDLPASLSFRTRVRIVLETRLLGTLWTVFQVLATLVGCAFYVVRTYNMALEEYGKCEVAFGVIVAADLLVRWYADDSRRYFIFKSSSLIDVASLLPLLIDAFIRLCHGTKLHFGFIFLRSVKVIKLLRVLRLFRLKKKLTSAAAQQMLVVALVAASLIFVSASLINITEGLPFGTSVYYTIVTMATVGYGDISVTTSIGRFVVCCVIIASFVWLPMEINKLTQMLSLRSRFLTTFTPEMEKPNVLVVGHLEAGKLRLFLTEFFHPDRRSAIGSGALYQVVVLNPEDPSDELVEVLEDPLLESRVTYVKGTLMNEDDLKRAGAHTALACFILANWITADSEAEDAQTVLRTLMIKTFRPTMPCYVQLHHAHNRVQLHMLKKQRVTCIEEIKMSILGTAAVYPGFTTLLSNLITSSSDQGEDTAKLSGWMREYALGSGKELYSIKLHAAFHGVSFRRAAMDIFTQFEGKVLLMGVEERELKASKDETGRPAYYLRRALLNPGSDYIFNVQPGVQTWAFVLARNRRTAERILTLENSMQQLKLNTDDKSTSGGKKKKMKRPRRGTEEMLAYYSHDVMDDSRQERRGSHGDDDEDDDEEDDDRGQQKGSDVGQPATAPVLVQQQQPLPAPPLGALAVVTEAVPDQAAPPPTDTTMASAQAPPSAPPSSDVEPESNASRFRVDDSRLQLPPPPPQPTEDAGVLPLSQSVVVAATAEMVYKDVSLVLVDDVSDLDFVKDHVVVMGAGLGSHLDFFLAPLRAAYLSGTGYSKHVVVFSETGLRDFMQDYGATTSSSSTGSITTGGATPTGSHTTPSSQSRQRASSGGQSGSSASTPPRYTIYVVEGSPHKASDLRRAGLERASAVVVLADKAAVQDIDEEVVDQSVIHQFLTIEKFRCRTPAYPSAAPSIADVAAFMLQQRRASPLNYVVEVLSVATLKILDQTYKTCKGKSRARDGHRKSVFRRSMHYLASNANRVSSSLHHHHHHHHHKRHTDGSGAGLGPSTLATPPLSKQNSVDRLYAPSSPLAAARHATPTHHAAQRKPSEAPSAANGPLSASHERSSMEFGIHSSNCYPFVTSGSSFLIDVFDVMSCQLFFNSDMLRFVDLLLALDTHDHRQHLLLPTSPSHASHTSNPFGSGGDAASSSSSASPRGAVGSGRLGAVSIPLHAAGQEFSYLFELFMHDYDALPIALYRHDEADDVCYVYTGPSPATALRASDIVFFLAPAKSMARIFSDNPPRARGQQGAGGK